MCHKMRSIGARDVTAETKYTYYGALSVNQRYYWWELRDHAVVAILLAGETDIKLRVVTIEIGEPGRGVEGIANWRAQKLKGFTHWRAQKPKGDGAIRVSPEWHLDKA